MCLCAIYKVVCLVELDSVGVICCGWLLRVCVCGGGASVAVFGVAEPVHAVTVVQRIEADRR